jgi:hypothetical protein
MCEFYEERFNHSRANLAEAPSRKAHRSEHGSISYQKGNLSMKSQLVRLTIAILSVIFGAVAWAQDTASITGTVVDPTGAAIANAQVTVSNSGQGILRTGSANGSGDYLFASLPIGSYDITAAAPGFKKFEAKGVVLRVAEKARIDIAMQVGAATAEVVVQGEDVAQVETQSSDLGGTVTGKEISQLELNGRDFKRLITLVPGVSNQTGSDEGQVGVTANNSFSVNGGRVEYNNWEVDGADILDNGQNNTLNVTPSIDAIGEFKVLTSNYGAQYGKNGSGTIEVETKSGTNQFHGDAYEFVRNNMFNAPSFNQGGVAPPYHKNDFGYTLGGPAYIPHVYNDSKSKTFFFWSQEWRRDRLPNTFNQLVPTVAERGGNFSDICALGPADCPIDPATSAPYTGDQVPVNPNDPNVQALLALIPEPNFGQVNVPGSALFHQINSQPTNWREELFKIDHNLNDKERLSFRYIHDSWNTLNETPLWTDAGSFPTIQTQFGGPGVSMVAHLSSQFSPTLLNEFVASYTTDHIILHNIGAWQRPSDTTFGSIFPGADRGVIPGINLIDVGGVYGNFGEDAGYIPNGPYNSNPIYSYKDNVSKIVGKHNLQFGAYFQADQKNELGGELGAGSFPGFITYNPSISSTTTGNPFSDLLLGYIASFGQQSNVVKYYSRYKMLEPYFNDDWHVSSRLTLNLGVRVSLFGTYREKYNQTFNFNPVRYTQGQTTVDPSTDIVTNLTVDNQTPALNDLPNGIVRCDGTAGTPVSCMQGHIFNPAPRVGFAWDPHGNGKMAIRGGYGIFFEHGNGNEGNTNSLENSPPLAYTSTQNNIVGYPNIGTGTAAAQFPLSVIAIPTQVKWPYVQQWHLDWQGEVLRNTVATISYVGSKGTHLARESNLNQLHPTPASQNPYTPGEAYNGSECSGTLDAYGIPINATTPNGAPIQYIPGVSGGPPSGPAVNVGIAECGANPDPFRPYPGYSNITFLQPAASSTYNSLQVAVRRSIGGLELNLAYTYSHSIDDSSDRSDGSFTDAYDPAANRASSNFDERHVLNAGYVWDVPVFKSPGLAHRLLGGWQYSGITTFSTGSPFSVTYSTDNAGVANGVGSSSYADIVGDPKAGVVQPAGTGTLGRLFYNPAAYAAPTGLTFGDSGRNSLRNPDYINFDMGVFKHFAIKESTALEFRAEAFNVFNHTEWLPIGGQAGSFAGNNNSGNNTQGSTSFLYSGGVHEARVLQFALKFLF